MKLWIARAVSTQPFISWGVGGLMLYWFKCVFLLFLHTQPYCPNHLWLPSPDTNLLFQRSNDNNRLMEAYAQTHYCRLKTCHLMQPLKVLTWLSEVKQVQFFQFIALDELNEVDYNFKVCPTRLLNLFFHLHFGCPHTSQATPEYTSYSPVSFASSTWTTRSVYTASDKT